MAVSAVTTRLLVFLHAFMAVLVVNTSQIWLRQCVVSVCDLDKLLCSLIIARVLVWMVFLGQSAVSFLKVAFVGRLGYSQELLHVSMVWIFT